MVRKDEINIESRSIQKNSNKNNSLIINPSAKKNIKYRQNKNESVNQSQSQSQSGSINQSQSVPNLNLNLSNLDNTYTQNLNIKD